MSKKMNVILIMTDDQGCWSLGCMGNREIRTPNIDKLAAQGIRMDHFFSVSPVCSPARASLLTGRIPSQHGIMDWVRDGHGEGKGDTPVAYLDGILSYTELLAQNGYACGLSGKWHMGAANYPQKGFSHWLATQGGSGTYHNAKVYRGTELVETSGYLTDVITDDALGFMEECHERDVPFCLNLCYTAPHSPHVDQHKQEYVDYYREHCTFGDIPQDPRNPGSIQMPHDIAYSLSYSNADREYLTMRDLLSGYYAAVQGVDDGVGRVLRKLDELGIGGHTLVVYTSDNGFNCGQHGIWGKGNGTNPLNLLDTSVRVPCIFRCPDIIPAGRVSDALLSGYDFMPTLLDLLEIENPQAEELPGHTFKPLLFGDTKCEYHESITVFDEYGPSRMIRTREWKYIHHYPYGPHELYDLVHDAGERFNLLSENRTFHYGPAFIREKAEELKAVLDEWFSRYVNPEIDGVREPVSGRGQLRKLGAKSSGGINFHPAIDVEYRR